MRALIQRVSSASVEVPATGYSARIGPGMLILLGVEKGDGEAQAVWLAEKCAGLRIFPDDQGKMNRSIRESQGEALVVSQFTLLADCERGRRPGFERAAPPEEAIRLYERFCELLERSSSGPGEAALSVRRGVFQAEMKVSLVNEGPVTILLERRAGQDLNANA